MNPIELIPVVDPIPIAGAWFNVLLVITFIIHILMMNCVLGASAISLVEIMRGQDLGLTKRISRKLPTLLALSINFGVAPLLFLQVVYGNFDYVSSVLMGGLWLSLIAVLLGAYYGLYIYDFSFDRLGNNRGLMLAFALACMLFVSFLFSNNMTLMLQPETWLGYFEKGGATLLNLADPAIYPRWLHFMTSALAVGGLFIALVGRYGNSDRAIHLGMAWFARATMVNVLLGLWFLVALPRPIMLQFMGDSLLATGLLLAAFAAALALIWTGIKQMVLPAAGLTLVMVTIMAVTRHLVRAFYLAPYFKPADLPVTGDFSSFFLFLGGLVLALPIFWWMVRTYCRSGACDPAETTEGGM
ncbi:MAG: hypothetical protein KKB70_01940 [Proteobacteria bacterium]|nr:hypothetical protein [Pseudomonadota bacterium]